MRMTVVSYFHEFAGDNWESSGAMILGGGTLEEAFGRQAV